MNLTSKTDIKELLKKHNAKPDKYLGQHFILSKKALNTMIKAAEIKKSDIIVEIGPGLGALTRELAVTGAKIIAVEKDPMMTSILKETLADYKNVKIIQADARQLLMSDINSIIDVGHQYSQCNKYKYKIVANLPYNVATFLIRQWLELNPSADSNNKTYNNNNPELMVLMIQKEVAQRIVAKPPHSNLLGISIQFYANVKIIGYVPAEAFWPKPKVDAAIIKIVPKENDCIGPIGSKQLFAFFRVVKAGFFQPRKQLANNLSKKLNIPKKKVISIFRNLNISEQIRAENLTLKQWQNLASRVIHN